MIIAVAENSSRRSINRCPLPISFGSQKGLHSYSSLLLRLCDILRRHEMSAVRSYMESLDMFRRRSKVVTIPVFTGRNISECWRDKRNRVTGQELLHHLSLTPAQEHGPRQWNAISSSYLPTLCLN